MRRISLNDWSSVGIIMFFSVFSVLDLFINRGQSANMDGIVHIITANLFAHSLVQGNFPVSWIDNFANYGLPLGVIAQQVTTYLTSFFVLVTSNPVLSFNLTLFLGVVASSVLYYYFLRFYVNPFYSLIGVLFFMLAPYRIMNIYIRGALPEFFASVFIVMLLISIYLLIKKRKISGYFLFIISIAAIILTHPFMLIVSSILFFPYIVFLLSERYGFRALFVPKKVWQIYSFILSAPLLGIGIAGYYLLPLVKEIKYFYYGSQSNHLNSENYLSLANFFGREWYFFTPGDIFARGFFVSVGLLESLIFVGALGYLIWKWSSPDRRKFTLFEMSFIVAGIYVFFMTKLSAPFYHYISLLSNIQFPWRMLSGLSLVLPILLVFMLEHLNKKWLAMVLLSLLFILRFPQLYGKNYTVYPKNHYEFTDHNLHAVVMNPVWSGRSEDYPIKIQKPEIIEGEGMVNILKINDTWHRYQVETNTALRLVDYTFYFPGWKLYIDAKKSEIEYQDPKYRGVITYVVPIGKHIVDLRFEDTLVRKIGKLMTIISLCIVLALFWARKRLQHLLRP